MSLGRRLALLRVTNGLTQNQVAKHICISRSRYSHYETDRSEPDLNVLKDLATLFRVPADYLLGALDSAPMEEVTRCLVKPDTNATHNILDSPVLGITKAGKAVYAGEYLLSQQYLTPNLADERYCYFRAVEDVPKLKIQQGDLILVDKQYPITNGTIVAVNFKKEKVIKLRYTYTFTATTLLLPINPLDEPVQAWSEDIDIIGKAMLKIGLIQAGY